MPEYPEVLEDVSEMFRTNYMGFASFTILIWDHFDTFDREVEHIWMTKKNLMTTLFLINRYVTPLGFIVNLFAYLSPTWTPERCSRFIRYEGSMTIIGINIVALMMFLRIKALYHRQYFVLGFVGFVGLFSFSMNAYLMTRGVAVVHNPSSGVRACTMIFDAEISTLASSSAWLPLLYDTVVLCLTLYKTLPSLKNRTTSYVMKRLFQDGLIYYSVIFAVTFVLSIMIAVAPPGIKNITAQLELLLTVAMMSRITINLKSSVHKMKNSVVRPVLPSMFTQQTHLDVASDIKIVAPGFNQTRTIETFDFGAEVPMGNLRREDHTGDIDKVGLGRAAITILTPPKKQRLSTIPQEKTDWETSAGTVTEQTRSGRSMTDSVGLETITEKRV